MTYLLDTNALIILLFGDVADGKLSRRGIDAMLSADRLYLSVASLWEMAIKMKIGKLRLNCTIKQIEQNCERQGIELTPIKTAHLEQTLALPLLDDHKDPFDRLILATAIAEHIPLISTDARMRRTEYAQFCASVIR